MSLMEISRGVVSLCQNQKRLANKQRQAFKAVPFELLQTTSKLRETMYKLEIFNLSKINIQ